MAGKTCIQCGKKTMFKNSGTGGYTCTNCNMEVVPAKKTQTCVICGAIMNNLVKCKECGAKIVKKK